MGCFTQSKSPEGVLRPKIVFSSVRLRRGRAGRVLYRLASEPKHFVGEVKALLDQLAGLAVEDLGSESSYRQRRSEPTSGSNQWGGSLSHCRRCAPFIPRSESQKGQGW